MKNQSINVKTKDNATEKKSGLFRVLGLFGDFKWRMVAVIIIGIVGIVLYSQTPAYLREAIDKLNESLLAGLSPGSSQLVNGIITTLAYYLVFIVINEIFAVICYLFVLKYEEKAIQKTNVRVKRKLDVAPMSFLDQYTVGDLTRIVAYNTGDMMKTTLVTLFKFARLSFFYITSLILMFNIDWILALVVFSSLPLCIFAAKFISGKTQKLFNSQNTINGQLNTFLDKKITLHGFFKLNGMDSERDDFEKWNKEFATAQTGEATATALNTIYITFINNFYKILITVLCCLFIVTGRLEFAALPVFLECGQRFLANAVVVTDATNLLQLIGARAERIFKVLDHPDDITEKEHIEIKNIKGEIAFRNVSLRRESNELMLENVSFAIPQGKNVAFVGPTGGGKRSIIELLSKLALQTEGSITVDGMNLDEISSRSYYDRMGIAFEKPFIFKGSVAQNILYGIGRTLPENVMGITKKLGSHSFIEQLPQGYETELWENTTLLSISQKQALSVARTALQGPDLAIFDEAISAADTLTEKQTFEAIMKLDERQTTIFVTSRLASIQNCDIIYFIERGRIAEKGTHQELMKKKKKYYKAFTGN